MIAILLAGGKGSRLGKYGRLQSKALMPVRAEPVINYIIEKLLAVPEEISQIFILARQKQFVEGRGSTEDYLLDLKSSFDNWRRGLLRFLRWINSGENGVPQISEDESILVCAAKWQIDINR